MLAVGDELNRARATTRCGPSVVRSAASPPASPTRCRSPRPSTPPTSRVAGRSARDPEHRARRRAPRVAVPPDPRGLRTQRRRGLGHQLRRHRRRRRAQRPHVREELLETFRTDRRRSRCATSESSALPRAGRHPAHADAPTWSTRSACSSPTSRTRAPTSSSCRRRRGCCETVRARAARRASSSRASTSPGCGSASCWRVRRPATTRWTTLERLAEHIRAARQRPRGRDPHRAAAARHRAPDPRGQDRHRHLAARADHRRGVRAAAHHDPARRSRPGTRPSGTT